MTDAVQEREVGPVKIILTPAGMFAVAARLRGISPLLAAH
jgi:hypothetical protein